MKSPLWILNSILTFILISLLIYISISYKSKGTLQIIPLKPLAKVHQNKYEKPKAKDIKLIYEGQDLFSTYKLKEQNVAPIVSIPNLPKPPSPKPIIAKPAPEIQFLEPLPIKISGIISGKIESDSQVTFVNTKTKIQESYKVGDKIFDAYIIRIFPNKVILIRSNGQQETLYRDTIDATQEIKRIKETVWTDIVQRHTITDFVVNGQAFVNRITSLAQLIEMLDATTAFTKGESIGCRIGKIDENSLGYALGFSPGDIITNIADIAPTTTTNRINIYNKIHSVESGQEIPIKILRNNKLIVNTYKIIGIDSQNNLEDRSKTKELRKNKKTIKQLQQSTNHHQITETLAADLEIMKHRQKIRKLVSNFKKNDRQAILQYGGKNSVLKNSAH